MKIINTINDMRLFVNEQKKQGKTVGFVPTMGALHDGHLHLVQQAKVQNACTIVSIFVNPLQFAAGEDFSSYPRVLEHDCHLLKNLDVDAVFVPSADEIYQNKDRTTVQVGQVSQGMEGTFRPHFFSGVATIVTKLLTIVQPDQGFFGEKDYQQLCVIRALCQDLNIPVQIIGVPTVRGADGLALSSRNQYLSSSQQDVATVLYETMVYAGNEWHKATPITDILQSAKDKIMQVGFIKIDYFLFWDVQNWCIVEQYDESVNPSHIRIFVAAVLGTTRLIDNKEL